MPAIESETDVVAGFAAASCAPALIVGLIFLPLAGPLALFIAFYALIISLMHVILLAVPIYFLISRWRVPGPATVLISAALIGALPIPLLLTGQVDFEAGPFALLGFVGGCAFLGFAYRGRVGEGY